MHMTLFQTHNGQPFGALGLRRASRFSTAAATRRIASAFKTMHRAIVAAKLRRLRNELMLHRRMPTELDAAKFPQCPLLLGDKWDF
jgi:hypothetical protein